MAEPNRQNVFDFIISEENYFQTNPVQVSEGYEWSFFNHIKLTLLYKASKYETGNTDDKPFKNIIRPLLNLQYRAEGFDVKDIVLFVNEVKNYFKSFLVKKFHNKWARDNSIDTFIDKMVESYVDFGGALIKNVNDKSPEVIPLSRLAFCDQTDILSGPICEKHFYSPDQLKDMEEQGWENVDELIVLSKSEKDDPSGQTKNKTPGKYIKVYELHGNLPAWWLSDEEEGEENKYINQVQIVAFYTSKETKKKNGIMLFKGKETKPRYKFVSRDEIFGRALGFGGAEELFEPQVWINYDVIRMKALLDAAAKIVYTTTDPTFGKRNNLKAVSNEEILTIAEGQQVNQLNNQPVNIRLFEQAVVDWENLARTTTSATESILGESPTAGTPFKLQELVTAESHSLHEYRKGKLATFLGEVYRDWIIPHIAKEINQGQEFLEELDADEMMAITDSVVVNEANRIIKEKILSGELVDREEIEKAKIRTREIFIRGGNKKFFKILKEEMKNAPIDVYVNIVGKQKNLSAITDKLVNVFRQILANPAILQDPRMAKLFNQILEASGLSPLDFYQPAGQQIPQPVQQNQGQPAGKLAEILQ